MLILQLGTSKEINMSCIGGYGRWTPEMPRKTLRRKSVQGLSLVPANTNLYISRLSWIALNNWPCSNNPRWTDIGLYSESLTSPLWSFRLVSMKFFEKELGTERLAQRGVVRVPQRVRYVDVILDTGKPFHAR